MPNNYFNNFPKKQRKWNDNKRRIPLTPRQARKEQKRKISTCIGGIVLLVIAAIVIVIVVKLKG